MTKFDNKKVLIVGLGLIGGSIAKSLQQRNICSNVWAYDHDKEVLRVAKQTGEIADYGNDIESSCVDADLIIIAVPGLTVQSVLTELKSHIAEGTVLTDVCSVKCSAVEAAETVFGKVPEYFVPGHPIAGSEKSGFGGAQARLFDGKKVILTPLQDTNSQALSMVASLWQAIGAVVLTMSVQHHDEVLAATSHLPHLLAYALVDTLSQQGESEEIFSYAAGGFRDFTRIASSDPRMWKDIFLANGDSTLKILDKFTSDLATFRQALVIGDADFFMKTFTRAKNSRDKFLDNDSVETEAQQDGELMFTVKSGGTLKGEYRVPGDKSISHRSIILGSIAEGTTTVNGFLQGEDSLATLAAFRKMGVVIDEGPEAGSLKIQGRGLHGLEVSDSELDLGNSGTSMRLLSGLLAAQSFSSVLTGDESLSKRPMKRVCNPLQEMGAKIELQEGGLAPITINPASLKPIIYDMPVASAQVKSCLLLASLYVHGTSTIIEPAPCRDHTERMLQGFGYDLDIQGNKVTIKGQGKLTACHIDIPADISSAAFFMVAASISPGSDIVLKHVGINPTRIGIINILKAMGGDIEYVREYSAGGEPVADIRIKYAPLKGINIPEDQVPLAIDEFPAVFIAAACAQGITVLSGAEELRVKESDRIQAMADGLAVLGVRYEVKPDGIIIHGNPAQEAFGGGDIDSKGDHRIAMAFAVSALRASSEIRIYDCNNVATSFPNFSELANSAGLGLQQQLRKV